jgi:hypothetical protein
METVQQNTTTIILSKDDVSKILGEHLKDLTTAEARIQHGQQQGRFVVVAFDIPRDQIDAILRPLIPNLPPLDEYMGPRLQDDGSAIVRWQNPPA